MEFIHMDAAGPFDEGLDGSRYWLTIVDDWTGWVEIIPIPRRQGFIIESLCFFLDHNERPERKCRRIRLDRIPEQVGEEMKFVLFSRAIKAEVTGVGQHQQNGVAERAHRSIHDRVGPTLAHARLPAKFWPEIARTAAYLSNRSPSARLRMTPYQAWYGDKPDLSRLRVIGPKGEYLIPPKQRRKLTEPRTRPCVLLGYEGNTNYRILLEDGRIVGTPNAEFKEVLMTPSTQTEQDVGAGQCGLPEATASAAGGTMTVGPDKQPSVSIQLASVPPSGRHASMRPSEQAHLQLSNSNSRARDGSRDVISQTSTQPNDRISGEQRQTSDNESRTLSPPGSDFGEEVPFLSSDNDSQPVAEGDMTVSILGDDDAFGSMAPQGDEPSPGGDQQRNDLGQNQGLGEEQSYVDLQTDRLVHRARDALENHPELRVRFAQTTPDASDEREEELALMNVPGDNLIPTFLTVAAQWTEPFEPKTVRQAKSDASWPEWEKAMHEEVGSLKQNKTWELVKPPKDRRVLSGKWVYKLKRGPHGEVVRHKARWVVRGFTQEEGVDYDETFASVVKPMSYKALFAMGAALGLEIEQMDVKTAFLYGDIDHKIYVEQPHDMTDGTPRVCKLKKALYGLKQAPRIWYQTLTNFLRTLGFEPINADLGIFVRSNLYIAVYVDDLRSHCSSERSACLSTAEEANREDPYNSERVEQ